MISVIITDSPIIRESIVQELQLHRDPHSLEESTKIVYRKGKWILLYSEKGEENNISYAIENYMPEKIYILLFGESLLPVHQIGDVIAPNVFFTYDSKIKDTHITKENRDSLIGPAFFTEAYEEQGDFLISSYGLSIGGIVLQSVPTDIEDELSTKIGLVYESDVMIEENLITDIVFSKEVGKHITILIGITKGKLADIPYGFTPETFASKNLLETIHWINQEES